MDGRQIPLKAWWLGLLEPTAHFPRGETLLASCREFVQSLSLLPRASECFSVCMSPVFRCGGRVVS